MKEFIKRHGLDKKGVEDMRKYLIELKKEEKQL